MSTDPRFGKKSNVNVIDKTPKKDVVINQGKAGLKEIRQML